MSPAAIRDVVEAVEAPRHIELIVEVEPDLAAEGDPTLLRQVLVGLLTNAFKNTPPPGAVTVRGRRDGEREVVTGGDRHRHRDSRRPRSSASSSASTGAPSRASRRASASAWRSPAGWST